MDPLFFLPCGKAPPHDVRFGAADWPFVGDRVAQRQVLDAVHWFAQPGGQPVRLYITGPCGAGKTLLAHAALRQYADAAGDAEPQPSAPQPWVVSTVELRRIARQLHTASHADDIWQRVLERPLVILDGLDTLVESSSSRQLLETWLDRAAASKQRLVVTAQARPGRIAGLGPRLVSRLADSLEVELPATPPPPVRRWLIRHFLSHRHAPFDEQVVDQIDEHWSEIGCPVAAMHGFIDQLLEIDRPASPAELLERLADRSQPHHGRPTLHDIARVVSRRFGVPLRELRGSSRRRAIVRARKMAIYLCRELTPASYRQIGDYFGRRDHSTAVHAHRAIDAERRRDFQLQQTLSELRQSLTPTTAGTAAIDQRTVPTGEQLVEPEFVRVR